MLLTIVISFLVMGAAVAAMSIGVIFQNKPIKGSCGGMAALGMNTACEICGGDRLKCEEVTEQSANKESTASFYDASK